MLLGFGGVGGESGVEGAGATACSIPDSHFRRGDVLGLGFGVHGVRSDCFSSKICTTLQTPSPIKSP